MKALVLLTLVLFSVTGFALERKEMTEVSINEILADTQVQADSGDKHLNLVWWVPYEYWASVSSRDPNMTDAARQEMLGVLREYTIIGIVQADISALGSFSFYSKERILKDLRVTYTAEGGKQYSLLPEENVSSDMTLLMAQITPILKAAMGNMGANIHFFIYKDLDGKDKRIIDPYKGGKIDIDFMNNDDQALSVDLKMPLNSLFVPRTCPNGEKAHVSWNYCPWSGKQL